MPGERATIRAYDVGTGLRTHPRERAPGRRRSAIAPARGFSRPPAELLPLVRKLAPDLCRHSVPCGCGALAEIGSRTTRYALVVLAGSLRNRDRTRYAVEVSTHAVPDFASLNPGYGY